MEIQRKALFNLLRMNWLLAPVKNALDWQVEDYRSLTNAQLFERLDIEEIHLDAAAFIAYADTFETPEELFNELLADSDTDPETKDRVYLLIFELWRRLLPEKSCLSIFCDELDHQIALYDAGQWESMEHLQDAIANLQAMLDENTDLGNDPKGVFQTVSAASANELEDFLYDFIADQIDQGNGVYASELLDGFYPYVSEIKWFDLLRARIIAMHDTAAARVPIRQLIADLAGENDLAFNLEVLAFMVLGGDREAFSALVKQSLPLLNQESDFKDLLSICADYFQRIDHDVEEAKINQWISKRVKRAPHEPVDAKDTVFEQLISIFS
jgi:hypothetical protein